MKLLFVLFLFSFAQASFAECFKEKELNRVLVAQLGFESCDELPHEVQIKKLTFHSKQDINLYAEDFARIRGIEILDINWSYKVVATIKIHIKGDIRLPDTVQQFYAPKLDQSEGKIIFNRSLRVVLFAANDFDPSQLPAEIEQVYIDGDHHLNLENVHIHGNKVYVKNVPLVRNITTNIGYFIDFENVGTVSNCSIVAAQVGFDHVKTVSTNVFDVNYSFISDVNDYKENILSKKHQMYHADHSNFDEIDLSALESLMFIRIQHVNAQKVALPVKNHLVETLLLEDVRATFQPFTMESMPLLENAFLKKLNLQNFALNVGVNERLHRFELSESVIGELNFYLQNPAVFSVLRLLQNSHHNVQLYNRENLGLLPSFFKVIVGHESLVKSFSELFGTSRVYVVSPDRQ